MHPVATHMDTTLHLEELRRQADDHRRTGMHSNRTMRSRAGAVLVRIGTRLEATSRPDGQGATRPRPARSVG